MGSVRAWRSQCESFGVTAGKDIAWLTRRMTPHPVSTYTTPVRLDHPVGNGLTCTYIRCTQPFYPGVDAGGPTLSPGEAGIT